MKFAKLVTIGSVSAQFGPPGRGTGRTKPRPAIDHETFGRPGEERLAQAPKSFKKKEEVFNSYLKSAGIPYYWSRDAQIRAIVDKIGGTIPTNEFDDRFISRLQHALLYMPMYKDVPNPSEYIEVPKWVPPTEFGLRGPPGELTKEGALQGDAWIKDQKIRHGSQHGGGNIYDTLGPPGEGTSRSQLQFDEEKWLQSYGYLTKSNGKTDSQISKSEMREAIKDLQYNYGLEETGTLNEETIYAMKQPRCGQPDQRRSAKSEALRGPSGYKINDGNKRWETDKPVTWSIYGYTPDMPPELVARVFDQALKVWQDVANIDFERLEDNAADADMRIYFGYYDHGDAWAFNGANGILAHAFFPDGAYKDLMGDMHFDESEFWTLGKGQVVRAILGTGGRDPEDDNYCHFPFFYKGIEYNGCASVPTPNGSSQAKWCSLTRDWEGKWGYCQPDVMTFGGNANGEMCHFPFTFLGKDYDSCTSEGREDGYYWCSPDRSFDEKQRYGFCLQDTDSTVGGNGDNQPCVFPFIFQGHQYDECTTVGRDDNYLWCATTSNYDTDRKFGFCSQQEYSLFHVAAHEAGHAIGLDHSNMQDALMYPSYHIRDDWRFDYGNIRASYNLPADDRRGAQQLYGARTRPTPAPRPTTRPTTQPTARPTTRPEVECEWSQWSNWSECHSGFKVKYRTCQSTNNARSFSAKNECNDQCYGESIAREGCGTTPTEAPTTRSTTIQSTRPTLQPVTAADDSDDCLSVTTSWTSKLCQQPFDAILQYAMETFVFRDDELWRIEGENHYSAAFTSSWQGPYKTSNYWADLPSRIDAVYRVPEDRSKSWASGNVRFFSGQKYWEFKGFRIVPGFPKSISELGLPTSLRFNAAINMRRGKGKTYRRFTFLFSGNRFYVYDEAVKKIVGQRQGYDMRRSPIIGLPHSVRIIGATPANDDGHSYFFTDDTYYRVDDRDSRVNWVGRISDDFLHCCKLERSRPNSQGIITGSGVCPRTNDFYDYISCADPDSLALTSGSQSKNGPSLLKEDFFPDKVAGWPKEYFRRRFQASQIIPPQE